jgi:DNA gyrase/topoisomerase IV subunit B
MIKDDTITMMNDGNGIDVALHPETKVWIPEMIFGHLRTSTNYDKTEKKIVGGKNGFGFKLVLIWSTYGIVETVDHIRGLKYVQEFKDNLNIICPPIITKCKSKPYTKITFRPDYSRLGISGLTDDMLNLLKRRVYDIAAVTEKNIKVHYNSQLIPVSTLTPADVQTLIDQNAIVIAPPKTKITYVYTPQYVKSGLTLTTGKTISLIIPTAKNVVVHTGFPNKQSAVIFSKSIAKPTRSYVQGFYFSKPGRYIFTINIDQKTITMPIVVTQA